MPRIWVNPIHLVIPPCLLAISLPLTVFAIATTLLALVTLLVRVVIVYSDLGLVLLSRWVTSYYKTVPQTVPPTPLSDRFAYQVENTKRKLSNQSRRPSSSQSSSPTSFHDQKPFRNSMRSDSYVSLLGAGLPNRDYEGVGGWRHRSMAPEEEESDDARWSNMYSRLELPVGIQMLATSGMSGTGNGLSRKRSLTGSSSRLNLANIGSMRMSPVASRTPIATSQQDEDLGYFALNPSGWSNVSRRRSMGMMTGYAIGKKSKKSSVDSFERLESNGR